ncbi:P-loop containing nucleoside triphosphate hydrolase protein [Stipitochalara longipes BDJ]|nr:P-loop containing nucleoside triphosphate hydrolase protein [Stipitochalara longipes BDJ]
MGSIQGSPDTSFGSNDFSPNTSFGSIELSPGTPLGYDFEDSQTRAQLELIDDLQKLGVSNYLGLPQLVVVGDQSTGKSSVLQAVTEVPFPINDEMCTRFATEIVHKRTSAEQGTTVKFEIIPGNEVASPRKEALSAWSPAGFDGNAELNKSTMESVFEQARDMIFSDSFRKSIRKQNASQLSSSTLRITRSGPKETNFAIVDIPGLIRGDDSHAESRTAKQLVQKYLENPRSIIVLVIDIIDTERQEVFQLLKNLPDQETRVIGVINKCDTKQKKSHDWVFDLIENDPLKSKHYLKEGWYGLRNRQASEADISDEERDKLERSFFAGLDWKSLNSNKLGRHHLKKALIQMRNQHIKKSIPAMICDIQDKLDECIQEINKLGEPRTDNQARFTLVNKIAARYSAMAEGALNGRYEVLSSEKMFARKLIRDNLESFQKDMANGGLNVPFGKPDMDAKIFAHIEEPNWAQKLTELPIYALISSAIKKYRAKEDIGEVNPEVKDHLWREQTTNWNKIAAQSLDKVERTIESVNAILFQEACPDNLLRSNLQIWLQDEFRKASLEAREEMERLIANEKHDHLFTLHPLKRERQQNLQSERVKACGDEFKLRGEDYVGPYGLAECQQIKPLPTEVVVNSLIYKNAEVVGILNTHDSLAAHYDVALYRFIDNFALQVVERHLLGPFGPLRLFNPEYVTKKLYGEKNADELSRLADEDPATAQARAKFETQRTSLEEGKIRVQNFMVL